MNRPRPKVSVTDVQSSLPPEEPIAAYRSGDYSPGGRKSHPSRRWFYDPPSGSFGSSSLGGGGGGGGVIIHARRLGSRTFHLPMDDSLLLLLVLLCLGDSHKFVAPIHQTPRLPAYLPSDGERKPSGVLLLPGQRKGHIKLLPCPIGAVT